MSWSVKTALELGRVSNLPTVWSNTLAGVVLAGVSPFNWNILTVLLAMSMAYLQPALRFSRDRYFSRYWRL